MYLSDEPVYFNESECKAQFIVHALVPFTDTRHRSFHPDGNSRSFHPDENSHSFHPDWDSHSFHPDEDSHSFHPDGEFSLIYTRTGILHGRQFTFSGYFAIGACRRMGEEDYSPSPDRHVRIL